MGQVTILYIILILVSNIYRKPNLHTLYSLHHLILYINTTHANCISLYQSQQLQNYY